MIRIKKLKSQSTIESISSMKNKTEYRGRKSPSEFISSNIKI